jgi:phage tail sheath gpL-like
VSQAPVIIAGWSSTSKVPGVVAEVKYGSGPINAASIPLVCLMLGIQAATGASPLASATGNQDVKAVNNSDDAADFWGARSEIANMAYMALAVDGVNLVGAGVIESSAGGVAAATVTITITLSSGTNPIAQGTLQYWLGGRYLSVSFSTTDTVTTIAASIVSAINANQRWPFTAANASGVVTVTVFTKGVRGNDYIIHQDATKAVGTNVISTPTGGAAVTGGGFHFTGGVNGSTVEAIATVLNVLYPGTYDFIAAAQYDATNAALFLAHSQQKAGPLEMRPSRFVFGQHVALATATSLAQTTLNDQRSSVIWYLNGETVPSELAAVVAAVRQSVSQDDPGAMLDGYPLPGVVPQRAKADNAQRATQESALASGVTPLVTVGNQVQIVRAIGTHSLTGATPDYRTLDWADDYVPDFIRKDLTLDWQTEYVISNPRVADDAAPEQRERPAGVATPTRWNQRVTGRLLAYETRGPVGPLPIVVNTELHPPTSGYDAIAKRIVTLVPVEVMAGNHAVGLSIRQLVMG